jgi:hypothetical protein
VPSVGTALKAGMTKVCDYPVYIGHFDPVTHLSERGYTAVGQGRMEEGLAWLQAAFERAAFAQGTAPGWAYYTAGCACAALERHEEAFGYLGQAIEHGFVERSIYEESETLRVLHGRAEWRELLERLGGSGPTG